MKRILTSDDVLALVRRGETELVMGPSAPATYTSRQRSCYNSRHTKRTAQAVL